VTRPSAPDPDSGRCAWPSFPPCSRQRTRPAGHRNRKRGRDPLRLVAKVGTSKVNPCPGRDSGAAIRPSTLSTHPTRFRVRPVRPACSLASDRLLPGRRGKEAILAGRQTRDRSRPRSDRRTKPGDRTFEGVSKKRERLAFLKKGTIMHNGRVSSECSLATRSIGIIRSARGRSAHRSRFAGRGRMLAMMASGNDDTPHPWHNSAGQGDHDGLHVTNLPCDHLCTRLYMSDTCSLGLNGTSGRDRPVSERAKQTQLCQNGRRVTVKAGRKARERSHRLASVGSKARERSRQALRALGARTKPPTLMGPRKARERSHQPRGGHEKRANEATNPEETARCANEATDPAHRMATRANEATDPAHRMATRANEATKGTPIVGGSSFDAVWRNEPKLPISPHKLIHARELCRRATHRFRGSDRQGHEDAAPPTLDGTPGSEAA
jgi:hypothetical protein